MTALGPLPSGRMDEEHDGARCGYPTKSGGPCRNKVDKAGRPCRMHMKGALLDRLLGRREPTEAPAPDAAPSEQERPHPEQRTDGRGAGRATGEPADQASGEGASVTEPGGDDEGGRTEP